MRTDCRNRIAESLSILSFSQECFRCVAYMLRSPSLHLRPFPAHAEQCMPTLLIDFAFDGRCRFSVLITFLLIWAVEQGNGVWRLYRQDGTPIFNGKAYPPL